MFGISGTELLIILFFGFLILGPEKLPELGRLIGRAIRQFRQASETMSKTIKEEVTDPFQEAMAPYSEELQETMRPLQEDINAINDTFRETQDAIQQPLKELSNPLGTKSVGQNKKQYGHGVREGVKPSKLGALKSDNPKNTRTHGQARTPVRAGSASAEASEGAEAPAAATEAEQASAQPAVSEAAQPAAASAETAAPAAEAASAPAAPAETAPAAAPAADDPFASALSGASQKKAQPAADDGASAQSARLAASLYGLDDEKGGE